MIDLLGIELTDHCNIKCKHCFRECGPFKNNVIDSDLLRKIIDESFQCSVPRLSCTGGEPFLFLDHIALFTSLCSDYNIPCQIISNGLWAKSKKSAYSTLNKISKTGLNRLVLSVDIYHQDFVSLENIHYAISTAKEIGIEIHLALTLTRHKDSYILLKRIAEYDVPIGLTPLVQMGRASSISDKYIHSPEYILGCPMIRSPIIDRNGIMSMCCGILLERLPKNSCAQVGDINLMPISLCIERHNSKFYKFINKWGPILLYDALCCNDKIFGKKVKKFRSPCEACITLLSSDEATDAIMNMTDEKIKGFIPWKKLYDIGFNDTPMKLINGADFIKLKKQLNFSSNSSNESGYVLSFPISKDMTDFIILDEDAFSIAKILYDSRGWSRISGEIKKDPYSIKTLKISHLLKKFQELGALKSI